ncbi:unnamed protein product [Tuber aestivum]|uniref:Uncharacterized protein n=1 Tax=Tuber aestivum TaxID=59557 RepID=A0A292PHR4_9PEZI|nr:unnamed protein product [Tuber aestivum]
MGDPSKETLQKVIHDLRRRAYADHLTTTYPSGQTTFIASHLISLTFQDALRQTVVVVENLTKLVHDPVGAREFLPRLQPGVKKIADTATLPAVRFVSQNANAKMVRAMKVGNGTHIPERMSVDEVKGN